MKLKTQIVFFVSKYLEYLTHVFQGMDYGFNASINIKKQGLKILSGSGIESDIKQKRSKALPLGESMTSEAHPISFAVGG